MDLGPASGAHLPAERQTFRNCPQQAPGCWCSSRLAEGHLLGASELWRLGGVSWARAGEQGRHLRGSCLTTLGGASSAMRGKDSDGVAGALLFPELKAMPGTGQVLSHIRNSCWVTHRKLLSKP